VAYVFASFVASRPVQFTPASAIVSRGTGRARSVAGKFGRRAGERPVRWADAN